MKPKYLFHGSARGIEGDKLLPKQATDLEERPENLHNAVYSTDAKEVAVAMAIISCAGVKYSSLDFTNKPFGIIYKGWPNQKNIYIYTLPIKTFNQDGGSGHQYYSTEPVKPSKAEELQIKDYLFLVRKATDLEREKFFDKYKHKFKRV